ncbi:hypothetical protein, partial [Streptomyces sp. SID8380]|uniref:hypothetical protein n=1 Tax=Streptomyces sp. SID8380 TaxID=2690360 RepID=UPI001F2FDE22
MTAPREKWTRSAVARLCREMEELGCPVPTIAAELRSRWGMRAREAFRHAAGLTHEQLADRLTEAAGGGGGGGG